MLGLIGVVAVLYGLWRWRPSTPQSAAGFSGYAMLLADLAGARDTFRLSDLPAQPAHLVRPPLTSRASARARARPVESGAVRREAGRDEG